MEPSPQAQSNWGPGEINSASSMLLSPVSGALRRHPRRPSICRQKEERRQGRKEVIGIEHRGASPRLGVEPEQREAELSLR